MKKFYVLLLLIPVASIAQIKFEKGYFIDNQNLRTECFIRSIDWNDTPTSFDYKLAENGSPVSKKDFEVSEFGVGNVRFISRDVEMDQSSDWADRLSRTRAPEMENVRVFLKVIVDGKYRLYRYDRNEMMRFYYDSDSLPLKQLIYKRFYTDNGKLTMARNTLFRMQLDADVKCENGSTPKTANLNYNSTDLIKYFEAVNACATTAADAPVAAKTPTEIKTKGQFHLKSSVFLGQHSFAFDKIGLSHDFGSKSYVTFGGEVEYILPFWNNKWSAIAEVSYNKFNETEHTDTFDRFDIEFKYLLFSVGARHYFFLNQDAKIFVNAVLNYEAIHDGSFVQYSHEDTVFPGYAIGRNSVVPSVGAGFAYSRFSAEMRYDFPGNPTPYGSIQYDYQNYKLIVRFQIL